MKKDSLLQHISSPDDIKSLQPSELEQLCAELREYIIEVMSVNPGHLASSLGTVELTVALHNVLNTPYDNLVWDVGHQAYSHKILTGRREAFLNNRKYNGISGFPKIEESEYDAFGTGHSSTSISAVMGMAVAAEVQKDNKRRHVAVIGDGSVVSGMAFEAMNHAGDKKANMLVILNDNAIAIDKNVGVLRQYFTDIVLSPSYNRFKNTLWHVLGGKHNKKRGSDTRAVIRQLSSGLKSTLTGTSTLFESFGFRYFGPVDGHNVQLLSRLMTELVEMPGPKLLHVVTKKGKGLKQAEVNPTVYHAPGKFNASTGEINRVVVPSTSPKKYQEVFGHTLLELAQHNDKIVGVTPAMATGCSLNIMMEKMPHRAFDVGIAEQHAVTFSAGMAKQGMTPFCNIYSTFMQRAYDQVIHDVALQKLNVVFCLDRGGIVGEDGPTHHGVFDMAYLRCIPNMIVSAPIDEASLRDLMFTAQKKLNGPFAIRYPRGAGVLSEWKTPMKFLDIGKGRALSDGISVALLTIGNVGNFAKKAISALLANGEKVPAHYDMIFLKPLDTSLLDTVFEKFDSIITVEDGTIIGGLGSAVCDYANRKSFKGKIVNLGVPDRFIPHGTPAELYRDCGYDKDGILETVRSLMK